MSRRCPQVIPAKKTCARCAKTYPNVLGAFWVCSVSPDGFAPWCRSCSRQDRRGYRLAIRAQAAYRERCRAYSKRHYAANREAIRVKRLERMKNRAKQKARAEAFRRVMSKFGQVDAGD